MLKVYLDSSAIIKRYISEPGSLSVDYVFDRSLAGEASLLTSVWNIGEALGVLDERRRRGWLSEEEFRKALDLFISETVRLLRLRILEILPVSTSMLAETWPIILGEHVYEADALQIKTSMASKSNVLLSSDKELVRIASKIGVKAILVKDEKEVKALFH